MSFRRRSSKGTENEDTFKEIIDIFWILDHINVPTLYLQQCAYNILSGSMNIIWNRNISKLKKIWIYHSFWISPILTPLLHVCERKRERGRDRKWGNKGRREEDRERERQKEHCNSLQELVCLRLYHKYHMLVIQMLLKL